MHTHDAWWIKQGKFPPGSYAQYVQEEQNAMKHQTSARKQREELGVSHEILPFSNKDYKATYYQVAVGQFGVKLPDVINVDTLDGLQLIKERGTRIDNYAFAQRIAKATGGVVMVVTEQFVRRVAPIPDGEYNPPKEHTQGDEPHDIRRGLEL
jgi:hypothetical protein